MARFVILSGIGYNVTVADRQVIFEEAMPVYGSHTLFAFERPNDIENSPGIWWLTSLDTNRGRIPACHLAKALEWCEQEFGKSFEPYKGELT